MRRFFSLSQRLAPAGAVATALVLATASGAAGVIHPGSYQTVFKSVTVADIQSAGVKVSCPTGNRMVTGAWHRSGQNGNFTLRAFLRSSAPRRMVAVGMRRDSTIRARP